MAPNGTYADVAAGRAQDASWGAEDSLRRLDRSSEQTPLLNNGLNSDASADGRKPSVWEGEADFEGVVWWKKPSVSITKYFPVCELISPGYLVITTILPLRSGHWGNCRTQDQPDLISCMPRVSGRTSCQRPKLHRRSHTPWGDKPTVSRC